MGWNAALHGLRPIESSVTNDVANGAQLAFLLTVILEQERQLLSEAQFSGGGVAVFLKL